MITNPELGEDPIWCPMVEFQLGLTSHSDEPCVMLNFIGETGEKQMVIYEDLNEVTRLLKLVEEAEEMFRTALETNFHNAVAVHGEGAGVDVPDDISSLFHEEDE